MPHTESEASISRSLSHIENTCDRLGNDGCGRTRVYDLCNEVWLRFANLVNSVNGDARLKGPVPGFYLRGIRGTDPEAENSIVSGYLEGIRYS